jgi:hypothetical protein
VEHVDFYREHDLVCHFNSLWALLENVCPNPGNPSSACIHTCACDYFVMEFDYVEDRECIIHSGL